MSDYYCTFRLDPTLARLLVSDIIKIQSTAKEEKSEKDTSLSDLATSLVMTPGEVVQLQDQMRKVMSWCLLYLLLLSE